MDFNDYLNYIKKHDFENRLYYYYIYRAIYGQINFSLPFKEIKKNINREWSRKSEAKTKNEPFQVLVKFYL